MTSHILVATAIESALGALLTGAILYLVLARGGRTYHYLFAAVLLICLVWDVGIFILAVRNGRLEELPAIGFAIGLVCVLIPALLFHFACLYTGHVIKWAITLGWILTGAVLMLGLAGLYWNVEGVHVYDWGNVFRVIPSVVDPIVMLAWFALCLAACWLLFTAARRATSRIQRRHCLYIGSGLLVLTFAIVKAGVVYGINVPILLPMGMLLVDVFNAIIGVAIIKDRLFDITLMVSKGTLYSILAGLLIFIYSLSEHLLVTYFGELIGGRSGLANILSIAVGVAVLMPVKQRLERRIDGYFAHKKLEF